MGIIVPDPVHPDTKDRTADYTVGVPLPGHGTVRHRRWLAVSRWVDSRLHWLPPSVSVSVDIGREGDDRASYLARVTLYWAGPVSPEDWAGGVARVWEDGQTYGRPIDQPKICAPFYALTWTVDGVTIDAATPHGVDPELYRAALVAAGVLPDPVLDAGGA